MRNYLLAENQLTSHQNDSYSVRGVSIRKFNIDNIKKFMKNYLFNATLRIFLYIVLCTIIIIPCKVHALDVTIGPTMWYTWMGQQYTKDVGDTSNNLKVDQFFFIGPALSVKFNDDFNLTFVYLYGESNITEKTKHASVDYKFKRHDADLTLNYRLTDYFKVFAGIKYMNYSMHRSSGPSPSISMINKRDRYGFGPGLGLSAAFPILEDLFLLSHLSWFCTLIDKESVEYYSGSALTPFKPQSYDYGINSGLSIAYYIAPASTTISLGGRCQYIKTVYTGKHDLDYGSYYDYNTSMFYGVTLMATYSFSI